MAQGGVEDEITCPLCLGIYEDPKILVCGHIYCREPCLTGLARLTNNATITCPECRKVTPVQGGDINAFPTVYKIVSLVDKTKNESDSSTCQTHKGQEIAIYCHTCSKTLCRDCVLSTTEHKEHNFGYIKDIVPQYREQIRNQFAREVCLEDSLTQAITRFEDTKTAISNQQALISTKIDTEIDRLAEKLAEQKMSLHSQLASATAYKLGKLQVQHEEVTQVYSDLRESRNVVENALGNLPDSKLVLEMRQLEAQLEQVIERSKTVNLIPVVTANIDFCANRQTATVKQFHLSSGKPADPSKCRYESGEISNVEFDKEINLLIKVYNSVGQVCTEEQSVSVELHYVCDLSVSLLDVRCMRPGEYLAQFTPKRRGRHILGIKVNGTHIKGSPTSVFVKMSPQKLGIPVTCITGMDRPTGLTCWNGKILACEHKKQRIVEIDRKYKVVHEVASAKMGPAELTSDSELNIYVTTVRDNRLHKLDRNGHHLKATGSSGSGREQFDFANGIDISNDKLYVCDTNNHRVKVYDLELNLIEIIGKKGSKLGRFLEPMDLGFDTNGAMYVLDGLNSRIQVFSPERKPIREFGNNWLNKPTCNFVVGNFVFVTEAHNNRVTVFTTTGEYITVFGEEYLYFPEGIAVDEDGFVYVTSDYNRVLVF